MLYRHIGNINYVKPLVTPWSLAGIIPLMVTFSLMFLEIGRSCQRCLGAAIPRSILATGLVAMRNIINRVLRVAKNLSGHILGKQISGPSAAYMKCKTHKVLACPVVYVN